MVTAPTGRRPCATSSYCSGNRICRVVSSIGAWPSSRAYVRTRSARQPEDKDDSSAGAAPIVIRGHPTGVRCTDLHSEPAQRASAVIRRLGTNRVAAGAMNARQPNRTISGRAGSRNGEMPIHRRGGVAPPPDRPRADAVHDASGDRPGCRCRPQNVARIAQEAGATPAALSDIGLP